MIKHEIKFVVLKFILLDQTLVHKKKKEHKNTIELIGFNECIHFVKRNKISVSELN